LAWGNNGFGQLGNGTTMSSSMPVQVSNLTNGVMISCGVGRSIASTTTGLA
jgi:alpha-tubulin suppressor-like RCC1 family protein